jgi:hypothetical protein
MAILIPAESSVELPPAGLSPLDKPLGAVELTAEEARRINARTPLAHVAVEPARPFVLHAATEEDRRRALHCLTQAIYYEAGFEPAAGQRAVAQVVLNRVRHPAFPKSVCGVVFQGGDLATCQFSFTCDGSLARAPSPEAWRRARAVAAEALAGRVEASVGGSTHYHADYVAPYWAPRLAKITQIGAHIFYRWKGAAGERVAFVGRYSGREAVVVAGRMPSMAAEPAAAPERRADNDLGGRITVGLGWTPSVPALDPARSAFARTVAADGGLAAAANPSSGG